MPVCATTLGFLINPIAGMGGRVGLKGTDNMVDKAKALGAVPETRTKAMDMLRLLARELIGESDNQTRWLTCSGDMGADCLEEAGFGDLEIVHRCAMKTSSEDTLAASREFLQRHVDLVLFCGGDGTARDICGIIGTCIPMLGIPAGVKMYSGVFGISPRRTAEIVLAFTRGELSLRDADVMDLDEERYRDGEWVVRLYDKASTLYEPTFTQAAKMIVAEGTEDEIKEEISVYLMEEMQREQNALWILGAGSTLQALGRRLGVEKSLFGIDAVVGTELVGSDLNEAELLELLSYYADARLVLSPIGAQGFVLGRGNSPLSPTVLAEIGVGNIIVVATPAKLALTPVLRFDTGDCAMDAALVGPGYRPVTVGYRRRRLVKAEI